MNAWPKTCGCGALYYPGVWTELAFVGFMEDGDGGRLELRNCTCGSTLAVEVEPSGLPWTIAGELAEVLRNDARDLEGFPPAYHWPPSPRRKTSPDDLEEAKRLHDIADTLTARVRAFDAEEPEAA